MKHSKRNPVGRRQHGAGRLALLAAASFWLFGCEGDTGPAGPPGPTGPPGTPGTPTALEQGDDPPGIHLDITGISGATGPGGNFQVGDTVSVTFTITKDDATNWDLTEMGVGRIMISGPTFNYQRVIPEANDLITASVLNPNGSYTYTFATPIPATYAAPYNDTASFGPDNGELTGMPLLGGTYTVGMYVRWNYTVDGSSARDADNSTFDFLFGGATVLAPREVVKQENCNRCHQELQFHGGMRREVSLCILCHTAGAEDRNTGGATPGASVDFKVMIHKIHNGKHLPSVLGVGTNPADGSRIYTNPPQPYTLVGFSTHNYDDLGFPVWPNLNIGMPRDLGYGALTSAEQDLEDEILTGVTDCAVCHGDPDGAGPLTAPAQGGLAFSQPRRDTCGSCHDDIDWTGFYMANGSSMPPQDDDSACTLCHAGSGDPLAVMDAHLHPLKRPSVNGGLNFDIQDVTDGLGGQVDAGDKVLVTLALTDDMGAAFDPMDLASVSAVLRGPTENQNLVLNASVPSDVFTGPQPWTFNLPQEVYYEYLGDSDAGTNGESWVSDFDPHWTGETTVWSRATPVGGTALSADVPAYQNFIDVVSAAGFAANDIIVIDDANGGAEEYLRVQWVDGNRLWFASPYQGGYQPGLRNAHFAGDTVQVAVLTLLTEGVDYDLVEGTGTVTETPELGDVAVVASYTTDFVMPMEYPLALNDGPDLDETDGQWTGKSLVDGTYSLSMWGYQNLAVSVFGEMTTYRGTSPAEQFDFLVGSATTLEPYDLISSPDNCYQCHTDLWFHGGGRRGFETCVACHGTAGAEDRPQYRAWGAPATPGVAVSFRQMIHKIHMGAELTNASSYTIVGFGPGGPPNNFSTHMYDEVVFPAFPGEARNCEVCHGSGSTAWEEPSSLDHPTEQGLPVESWGFVCGSCHDASSAQAHIASMTPAGVEACATCHDSGSEWNVEKMHKAY